MTKLFIALTSTHGNMQLQFLPGLMDWFRDRTIETSVFLYQDPYIVLARNTAAADFLLGNCTHLLFIDADIMFRAEHIKRLLEYDVPVIGGLYPKKAQGAIAWVCNALAHRPEPDDRGLIELKHIGTGFMMVKREVFEKMRDTLRIKYWEDETDRELWDFFDMPRRIDEKGTVRKLSEDWHFCNQARLLGFSVYGHTKVILRHIGTVVYPLESQVAHSSLKRMPSGEDEKFNQFAVGG